MCTEIFREKFIIFKILKVQKSLRVFKQPSLALRRVRADLIFLYKILHGLVDTDLKSLCLLWTLKLLILNI